MIAASARVLACDDFHINIAATHAVASLRSFWVWLG